MRLRCKLQDIADRLAERLGYVPRHKLLDLADDYEAVLDDQEAYFTKNYNQVLERNQALINQIHKIREITEHAIATC